MPAHVPPVADERAGLLGYLAQQRHVLRLTAHGLSDHQARATAAPSGLSVGGLIKHVAITERSWIDQMFQRAQPGSIDGYEQGFRLAAGESLAGVLDLYEGSE